MKILIEINDEDQAKDFLAHIVESGGIFTNDVSFVRINSVTEVSENVTVNRNSSTDSGSSGKIGYSKPLPY